MFDWLANILTFGRLAPTWHGKRMKTSKDFTRGHWPNWIDQQKHVDDMREQLRRYH